jgi:hypothetical protein
VASSWTILAQLIIATANVVVAAAALWTARRLWKQDRRADAENQPKQKTQKGSARSFAEPHPIDQSESNYLTELLELIQEKDGARSRSFQEMSQVDRIFLRIALRIFGLSILSIFISGTFIALFRSEIATGFILALTIIWLVAILVVGWKIQNTSSKNWQREKWKQVYEAENGLEEALNVKLKDERFGADAALAFHDGILAAKPRVWPPMILVADRAVIAELANRLTKKT